MVINERNIFSLGEKMKKKKQFFFSFYVEQKEK